MKKIYEGEYEVFNNGNIHFILSDKIKEDVYSGHTPLEDVIKTFMSIVGMEYFCDPITEDYRVLKFYNEHLNQIYLVSASKLSKLGRLIIVPEGMTVLDIKLLKYWRGDK